MSQQNSIHQEAREAVADYQAGRRREAHSSLFNIHRRVRSDLSQIPNFAEDSGLGEGYTILTMLHQNGDVDELQQISSIGYLLLSLSIEKIPEESLGLTWNRFLLLYSGREGFEWTIATGSPSKQSHSPATPMWGIDSGFNRESKFAMLLHSDLNSVRTFFQGRSQIPTDMDNLIRSETENFESLVDREYFGQGKTREQVLNEAAQLHDEMQTYLFKRLVVEQDIDF